jgi:hypothetical protein
MGLYDDSYDGYYPKDIIKYKEDEGETIMPCIDCIMDQVQFYDHITKTLKKSQKEKSNKFVKMDLIKPIAENIFHVEPIKGYNVRIYTVDMNNRTCNCQYGSKGKPCSHLFAVIQFLRKQEVIRSMTTYK